MAAFGNINERVAFEGNLLAVSVYCQFASQTSVNLRHWRVTAVGGAGLTFGQLATAFSSLLEGLYKPLLTGGADFRGVGVRGVRPTALGDAAPAYTSDDAGPGTAGANALPGQCCGLIAFSSNTIRRSGHGRLFMPFPDEADNAAGGVPTGGYQTALGVLASALSVVRVVTVGADSLDLTPVLLHRADAGYRTILGANVRPAWATQKRRGGFGRTNVSPV